ncbi:MAG: hypothetical protein ACYTBS_25350, partial [Planctomycetota bacterium]
MRDAIRSLMPLAAIVLLAAVNLGNVPASVSAPLAVPAETPALTGSSEYGTFARALELIQEGEFEAANRLIEPARLQDSTQLGATAGLLAQIIDEYEQIDERRQATRETAYTEALAELEKLQIQRADDDANGVSDVNDAND